MTKLSHALLLDEIATAIKRPTPEMVEAVAKAICALHEDLEITPWSEWADSVRDRYRAEARAAISAIKDVIAK